MLNQNDDFKFINSVESMKIPNTTKLKCSYYGDTIMLSFARSQFEIFVSNESAGK